MSASLVITGTGAVSPAGWGVSSLMAALRSGEPLITGEISRPSANGPVDTPVLRVPPDPAAVPKSPRLRRASPISRFAAAAAIEALGPARLERIRERTLRVGVIFTLTNGCVNYSGRFYGEVLADPSVASPILFPETVFNAPSSHLSALIGSDAPNDTLVADGAGFFTGIDLAAEWLLRDEVDGYLVVASEEIDWLSSEGLRYYSKHYLPSEGAAAIYLEAGESPVRLLRLPDPIPLSLGDRTRAAREIRRLLDPAPDRALLVDGTVGIPGIDGPELEAWADWPGLRWSPRRLLGESLGAAAALQTVAAVEAIRSGLANQAAVTAAGGNRQAAGLLIGT